jgi:uncharacterized FlgJ-related protein
MTQTTVKQKNYPFAQTSLTSLILLVMKVEDVVKIINCPPISARKRFTLQRIIKSPELKRVSIRKGKNYEEELSSLNDFYQGQQNARKEEILLKKLKEMKEAHTKRVEEERRRGEEKKALRKKIPYNFVAETATLRKSPRTS